MKCFYHKVDYDGYCSAAIVNLMHPGIEMIPANYNVALAYDSIDPDELVYVVDFSFPVNSMEYLESRGKLIWIDHHESSLKKNKAIKCDGLREIGKAGCELTWLYLFPGKPMPRTVKLLGRYDVWDHKDEAVLPFQWGMRARPEYKNPAFAGWKDILTVNFIPGGAELSPSAPNFIYNTLKLGNIILDYQKSQDETYAKGMAFEIMFDGLKAICMNKAYANSKVFDSVYKSQEHDLMLIFGVKPGEVKVTLYSDSDPVNCGRMAEKFGGGGHKGAAGFYLSTLPIELGGENLYFSDLCTG